MMPPEGYVLPPDAATAAADVDDSEQDDGDDPIHLTMVQGTGDEKAYEELEHSLKPGDHVLRWEMLPIAWPIQVHGIVLQVGKGYVTLADFGLTASPTNNNPDAEAEVDETVTAEKAPFLAATQKMEQAFAGAWGKMNKGKKKEKTKKQRITVHVVTTQKDLNRWHKVNYGRQLFVMGGEDPGEDGQKKKWFPKFRAHNKDKNQTADGDGGESLSADRPNATSPSKVQAAAAKVSHFQKSAMQSIKSSNSFARMSAVFHPQASSGSADNNNKAEHTEAISSPPHGKVRDSFDRMSAKFHPHASTGAMGHDNDAEQKSGGAEELSPSKVKVAAEKVNNFQKSAMHSIKNSNSFARMSAVFHPQASSAEVSQRDASDGSSAKKPHMNAAMAKLMAEKEGTANEESTTEQQQESKRVLPKSDPPKLVLARTYFLLQHGETVLPPYHIFHSNSECMAVFCKTGVWSTLQAAVFLHSTGIANAKTTFLTLGGMAAAAPILAPAIAVGGLAFVGAPYWMLRESKGKWEEATRKLTDLFWAQAEPEVFVECIEHWSGLVEQPREEESEENGTTNEEAEQTNEQLVETHEQKPDIDEKIQEEEEKKQDEEKTNNVQDEGKHDHQVVVSV